MPDFEIEISGEPGSYRVAARSEDGETGEVPVRFPFDDLALARQLQALELALLKSSATLRRLSPDDERPVQEFGRQLFEFAFPPEVRTELLAARHQAAQQGTPVRLRLRLRPPELAALPWEFLYDSGRDDYLCLSTPLVRYLDVPEPRRPLTVAPPLQILAMAARPHDLEPLNTEHEQRRLTEALLPLERSGRVQLRWVDGQTWWDLQAALDRGSWHIFHFIGHGDFDTQSGEGVLGLAEEDGGVHRLAASDLALLLQEHHSLRLVVLNSCDTARASATDRFSSTASALMRRGIPAVVAMQYEISDPAAVAFAQGFYTALAAQHPVDQAVTRARRSIKISRRNTLEWATPVLYLRSPTGVLFDLTDIPATPASPPQDTEQQPETSPTELTRLPHDGSVRAVAFSPDGTRLATGSDDFTARIWDLASGQQLAQLLHDRMSHDRGVRAVAFSPDGTRLVTGNPFMARIWDLAGQQLARLPHHSGVQAVAFSPDGTRLVTGGNDALIWDLASGQQLARLIPGGWLRQLIHYGGGVQAVAFSPDGTRLATGGIDRKARIWDLASGQQLAQLRHGKWVMAVAFSPDGTRLATGSTDNTARIWASAPLAGE